MPATKPITPTEAHYALRRDVIFSAPDEGAQLIADSEARATAELRGALALGQQNCDDVFEDLRAERDQLRAENATLRPQMSTPTPMPRTCGELSCDECDDRYAALAAERDQLRAEAQQAHITRDATCIKLAGELREARFEVEKANGYINLQVARAERAEAEVERLKTQVKDDNRSYGCELRDPYGTIWEQATKDHERAERAEAELAKERARLDWLEKRGPWESWNSFSETGITLRENIRAAIDAAMKEGAK